MNNGVILQTSDLRKEFGSVCAVDGVSLKVTRGQVYGFLGPNGSGKTTTIGMILGLIHPTSGSVHLFGLKVTSRNPLPLRRVGSLVGAPALLPYLSARKNLELFTRLDPEIQSGRIAEVLDLVGLKGDADRLTGKFSTGMKQRLGIAISLVHNPELLILDEPTNGMDPTGMFEIRKLLSRLSSQGVTVFISSHLLHEVEQICDRVAVIKKGRIIIEGNVVDLLGENKTVKVKVSSPLKTIQLLKTLPGCSDLKSSGYYVSLSGIPSERVVSHLVAHGIIPIEVHTNSMDLEDIYMKVTNEDSKEASHVLEPILD
ncbi:MAG: ATP-binding cassette domain-containing protein [Anaerolineales bacterium]